MNRVTLYHGTCLAQGASLVKHGWRPGSGQTGAHGGQLRYLYLTNDPENARWYAEERGCDTVVVVRDVPVSSLIVDPEDGTADSVEAELALSFGLPGSVALTKALKASHFSLLTRSTNLAVLKRRLMARR